MNSDNFIKLSPTKLFFRCAVPAAITSVFGALYNVIDGIFVGRYLGGDALAAINLIMPVIIIAEAVSNMIATGASVNISMLLGKKRRDDASKMFSFSVAFIIGISFLIAIFGYCFAEPFVKLIAPGASIAVVDMSIGYLKVYTIFGTLIPVCFAMDNYLRVISCEKISMIIGVVSQGSNIILDFVLLAVMHKGVKAAAFASCISIVSGSIVMLVFFAGNKRDLYYTKPKVKFRNFVRILINGSSEFFSNISMSIMSMIMNLFLLKYGETKAVATYSIVMYVDCMIGMLNFGLCDSLQPAISYCYGAKCINRMKSIFKRVLTATIIISGFAFLFMFFAGSYVTSIFVEPGDEKLLAMSIKALKLFAFSYLAGWIDLSFSSLFTAIDKPVQSLVVSLLGTLVFPVLSIYLLTKVYGLTGIWMSATAAAMASGLVTLIMVKMSNFTCGELKGCKGTV